MTPPTALILITLLTLPLHAQTAPSPWNEFRGPNGSGVAINATPPINLNSDSPTWAIDLPPGASSPVLWGNLIVVTAYENERLLTLAFNKSTGQQLWRREAPKRPKEYVHASRGPIASSPYIDDQRVYVYFGAFGLLCYDHDGAELWKKLIPTPRTKYGMATSPIIFNESLILILDNENKLPNSQLRQSKLIAVDRSTGKKLWETKRPFVRSSWSTPTLWEHDGATELVTLSSGGVIAYDASNGQYKWHLTGFSPEAIHRPFIGDGVLYVSGSMLGGGGDEQPDPLPFWQAVMRFDANNDQQLQPEEMTGHFTLPLRPDLPSEHTGFGIPLPDDPAKRQEKRNGFFAKYDTNKDGLWTQDEFTQAISFNRGSKPTLAAVRPGGKGDITQTHINWAIHNNLPETPTPILHNNIIYMIRDGGVITAVSATNGKTLYRKRLPSATGHYRASPVIANNHLYLISQEGELSVIKTGDDFELVHQHDFEDRTEATPAIEGSTIYIRTDKKLYAFKAD